MPSKSPAQALLEKADKKANSSTGWFSSANTKFEEAGDLYQQSANAFKMEKLLETFRERSPLTSHLLLRFMRPKERKRRKTSKGHYRPVENVSC